MPTDEATSAAADVLEEAVRARRTVTPVRHLLGPDVDAAYHVQAELVRRRVAGGLRVVGRKIGLTSAAVQAQLGVDEPDFGMLLDDMAHLDGDVIPSSKLLQPKVEAEVAFVLAHDLDGSPDPTRVRAAVGYAVAALEIVDSRISDWDISIIDTVADNASSGLYVVGPRQVPLSELEPRDVTMSLYVNGQLASQGTGRDCLGDPLEALGWVARTAHRMGQPLRAGEIVLSGALGPMVAVSAGDHVRAELDGLGSVSASFSEESS